MKKRKFTLLAALFFFFVSGSFAQTKPLALPTPTVNTTLGNMKLLPGYVQMRRRGRDSSVGNISKENGLEIRYDIGRMAGNYVSSFAEREKENVLWLKSHEVNGQKLSIVYLKDGKIYANFDDYANFFSTVKSNEELTDFLLMIMTYDAKKSRKKE
jgi:hypothetical protein